MSVVDIYKNDKLNSFNICDDFYNYAKRYFIKYSINERSEREIELSISNPSFAWMSIMYNYTNKKIQSYIEINTFLEENQKVRLRENIKKYSNYVNNKQNLLTKFKNSTKEQKIITNKLNYHQNIVFKCSDESFVSTISKKYKCNFYFVNSVSICNEYFKAEMRVRTQLDTKSDIDNDLLISYFHSENINRTIDFEIELNTKLLELDEKKFKEKFLSIFQFSVGSPVSNFTLSFGNIPTVQIKTEMIDIGDFLALDNKSKYLVTKKVDGETKFFHVKNGKCHIVNNNILLEIDCNIPKKYEIIGIGEFIYLNGKRTIIPFFFTTIKKKDDNLPFTTRLKSFEIFSDILKDAHPDTSDLSEYKSRIKSKQSDNRMVIFKQKEFMLCEGSINDFIKTVHEMYNKNSTYNTDGIIIIDDSVINPDHVIDFKLKKSNTVDVYTTFTLPSKSDETSTMNFSFILAAKNNSTKTWIYKELFSSKKSSTKDFFYDANLSMFVYKPGTTFQVYPVVFISEYDIEVDTFTPRLDKTNKMFKPRRDRALTYFGNNQKVVIKSMILHKFRLNLTDTVFNALAEMDDKDLIKFGKDYRENVKEKCEEQFGILYSLPQQEVFEDSQPKSKEIDNLIEPLNVDKNWYKENDNTRSELNIISNWNKTLGLYIAAGTFVNNIRYKRLFSIYCGKGGDMGKFVTHGITEVVGIDPDTRALSIFKDRHREYTRQKNKIFNLTTIDLSLENKNFIKIVQEKVGTKTYDLIDFQLGIHFSFCKELEEQIGKIFQTLANKNNIIKTKIVISTNDKDNINKILSEKKTKSYNFKINENFSYNISLKTDNTIGIFYSASMKEEMVEYLIDKKYFIEFMERYGFELCSTWTFDEKMEDISIIEGLASNYTRDSSKRFLQDVKKIDIKLFDLQQIASTYRYYIFESKY